MKSISSLKKILYGVCGLVVLFAGVLYIGFDFILSKNKEIVDFRQKILNQENKKKIESKNGLTSTTTKSKIQQVQNSLIASGEDVSFIKYVESLGEKNKVELRNNSISLQNNPELDGVGLTDLSHKFEIKGSWNSVYAFAYGIESLPYAVRINRFEIVDTGNTTPLDPKKEKAPGQWQALFDITVLKFK